MSEYPKLPINMIENSKYSHFFNYVSNIGLLSIVNIPFLLFFEAKITIWTSG